MHIMQRQIGGLRQRVREHRLRTRVHGLRDENQLLANQLRALREQLEHEREARGEVVGALKEGRRPIVEIRRGRGLLSTAVVGGVMYVLGAKAGRDWYEAIRKHSAELSGWAFRKGDRVGGKTTPVGTPVPSVPPS